MAVQNWKGPPLVRRVVKANGSLRYPADVSQHRVEREYDENDDGAQVVECQTRARHGDGACHETSKSPLPDLIPERPIQSLKRYDAIASKKIEKIPGLWRDLA